SRNLLNTLEEKAGESTRTFHSIQLLTLASSQILLIFATRTHPALLNLIFYAVLLYLISDSILTMEKYLPILNEYHGTSPGENQAKTPREKVLLLRELKVI